MSRTFVTSDAVDANILQKNEGYLLDNYILQNKAIPIGIFGSNVVSAIADGIAYLTAAGGGRISVPADSTHFELEIKVYKDRNGAYHTNFEYYYDRYPTTESRPYTSEDWQIGDIIRNSQPNVDKCMGWVCTTAGTPGTWTPFGWTKRFFSEIEIVDSLPNANELQAGRQLIVQGSDGWFQLVYCAQKEDSTYAWLGTYLSEEDQKLTLKNNLTTTEAGSALDARQGKVLRDMIVGEETEATLLASNWIGDSAPYSYTLSINGVTATSSNDLNPSLSITSQQLEALQLANITDGGQSSDTILLKAYGIKPIIDIPIRVQVKGE